MEMTHISIIIVYFTYLPFVLMFAVPILLNFVMTLARTNYLQSIRDVFLPKVLLLSDQATCWLEPTILHQNVLLDR